MTIGFLVALIGGSGQAITAQQKVASDLLRNVGAIPGPCREVLSTREYDALAKEEQAGYLVCGKYNTSLSKARTACEATAQPTTTIHWTSSRNHLQGVFEKNGYRYTIKMTCMGKEFMVQINKIKT